MFFRIVDDEFVDDRIGNRFAIARFVDVKTRAGFLAEAAQFANAIADGGKLFPRFGFLAFANRPADVQAGEIAHGKWPHGHAPFLQCAVDLLWQRAFFQ